MDKYAEELFKNSNKESDVPEEIIEKYRDRVSEEIINLWKNFGFCSTEDGYYKIVNPDDYKDIISELCDCDDNPIVIFITGMADMIVYHDEGSFEGFFSIVNIRHQEYELIGQDFSLTMRRMITSDFRNFKLSWEPYEEAVKKFGIPEYNECFAYEPLLSLGGNESVENLKKVNLLVHLNIVSEIQDRITRLYRHET